MLQSEVGDVSTISDFVPLDEFRASRIYKEFSAPQGYLDSIQAILEKSATSYAAATVILGEPHWPASETTRRRMEWLAPHFRRAVQIGKVIDLKEVKAAALADTLDGIAAGMLLLDEGGKIVHANAAGQAMVAEKSVIQIVGNRLGLFDPGTERALHDMLANLGAGDAALGARGISIPLKGRDGKEYVAQILPLTAGARRAAGVAHSAVAALFIREATLNLPHPIQTIAGLFRLTPAEMRVLMMIIDIGGIPKVAPVLGVSEKTVKTHLKHVFEKTGTRRQVDLVKLVAKYMNPLA
jgi:DNA-binding CsgD family transcriptional regulator